MSCAAPYRLARKSFQASVSSLWNCGADHDQGFRARVEIEIAQGCHAVFGDDVVRIVAWASGDARGQARDDAAGAASGRRKRDNGASAVRARRAALEIVEPAGAADLAAAEHFRIALAEQIDLDRRIDRHEIVLARNDAGRMGVGGRMKAHVRALGAGPGRLRADGHAGDADATVRGFGGIVEHALVHQGGDGVVDHAGMQAEMLAVEKIGENRRLHLADTDLYRVAVADQLRGVDADLFERSARRCSREGSQRLVDLDDGVAVFAPQSRLAGDVRHRLVDEGEYPLCGPGGNRRVVLIEAEGHAAVGPRRRHAQHGQIELHPRQRACKAAVGLGQVAQAACRKRLREGRRHEGRGDARVRRECGIIRRVEARDEDADEFDTACAFGIRLQRLDERHAFGRAGVNEYAHARLEKREGGFGRERAGRFQAISSAVKGAMRGLANFAWRNGLSQLFAAAGRC